MKFYVLWKDGRKFGPADITTLNQWIKEGRVNRDTQLENADTMQKHYAREITELVFPSATVDLGGNDPMLRPQGQQQAAQGGAQPGGQPQPYVAGQPASPYDPLSGGGPAASQQNPYQNPPRPGGSPYPRGGVSYDAVPAEIAGKFNWGAFCFTWIWGLNHSAMWMLWGLLVSCIPGGAIVWMIVCGLKGNEFGWKSGRFSSVSEFKACQRIWGWWGAGIYLGLIGLYVVIFIVGMVLAVNGQ
ncbi:MAG TPA: hypothetical protein VNI20_01600 [Fimbriimonadaceae bacterium]|nr:hypothetical protein [Fimbriimonadaceae bacterium]